MKHQSVSEAMQTFEEECVVTISICNIDDMIMDANSKFAEHFSISSVFVTVMISIFEECATSGTNNHSLMSYSSV